MSREKKRKTVIGRQLPALIVGLLLTFILPGMFHLDLFLNFDRKILDLFFQIRGARQDNAVIQIVTIDTYDRQAFNKNIKDWPRTLLAKVIDQLSNDGVYCIALDLDLSMPSIESDDVVLEKALEDSQCVVLGRSMTSPPLARFRKHAIGEGLFDLMPDKDGVVRSIYLSQTQLIGEELHLLPSLGLELAQLYLFPEEAPEVSIVGPSIFLDDLKVPGKMYINYCGEPNTFSYHHFADVFHGKFEKGTFDMKIVLIGNSSVLSHDYFSTPFPKKSAENQVDIVRMPGVEIHANILDTIISGQFITIPRHSIILALIVLFGLFTSLVYAFGRRYVLLLVALFLLMNCFIFGLAFYEFIHRIIWFPIFSFVLLNGLIFVSAVLIHWWVDMREKGQIRQLFSRYVSPQVAELLVENQELIAFQGRKEMLTIFFSDIRGFTNMSEMMDPQDVSDLLNSYFARMTEIIFKYDGTLDKFMGDAIMAFFGNPQPHKDHALLAIRMSLEMLEAVNELNAESIKKGRKTFQIGIGINTGIVTVGNLGSENYFDYTVIGDNVNLACRLESIAEPAQIIISKSTYDEVAGQVVTRELPPVKVKGKEKPVLIYEVLGLKESYEEQ